MRLRGQRDGSDCKESVTNPNGNTNGGNQSGTGVINKSRPPRPPAGIKPPYAMMMPYSASAAAVGSSSTTTTTTATATNGNVIKRSSTPPRMAADPGAKGIVDILVLVL